MSESLRDRMVEKVRKLFAKSESTEHEAEAEAFEAKAMALMAEWEIEERELRTLEYGDTSIGIAHFGRAQVGAGALAQWIAEILGGYAVTMHHGNRYMSVKLYGTDGQIERTTMVLDHLFPQLLHDLTVSKPRSRKSFALGWATRVAERYAELQQEAYAGSNLPVPTNTAAKEHALAVMKRPPTTSSRSDLDPYDAEMGLIKGNDADLGQQRIEG